MKNRVPAGGVTPHADLRNPFPRFDPRSRMDDDDNGQRPGDIDVWTFSLASPQSDIDAWLDLLSDDERDRAARLRQAAARDAYVVAHGVLRRVLALQLITPADRIRYVSGPNGKPRLDCTGDVPLHFNLAHSGGAGIIAVSRTGEVGVDIEAHRDIDVLAIAARYFTPSESEAIRSAPRPIDAFFRHWVAKEAVLKAVGCGLACPLDAFAVQFSDARDSAGVKWRTRVDAASWHVYTISVEPGWHAALCAAPGMKLRMRRPGT